MKTAVITGASSGLGEQYYKELSKEKYGFESIWLIARRREKLEEMAQNDKRVKILSLDLCERGSFDLLSKELSEAKAEIGLLINNAGVGTHGDFDTLSPESQARMTDLNVTALTLTTSVCLPFMKQGSAIINVSSIASFAPNPGMTVYSSTKAYVLAFSKCLREELRKKRGINVLAVCPGPMDTEFLDVARIRGNSKMFDTLPYCDPEKVVTLSVRRALKGKAVSVNLLLFKLYRVIAKILPHNLVMKFSRT